MSSPSPIITPCIKVDQRMHANGREGGNCRLSAGRSAGLVFLGVVLGIGLTIGTYWGVREYAPDVAAYYAGRLLGSSDRSGQAGPPQIDSAVVKGLVQDILVSEQGKAIVHDLIRSQSKESLDGLFEEALKSPEFRKSLSEALGSFLRTEEGRDLLRSIAKEALTP